MKCLNDKSFCSFEITDLQPSGIHQLIVTVPETDAVAGIMVRSVSTASTWQIFS